MEVVVKDFAAPWEAKARVGHSPRKHTDAVIAPRARPWACSQRVDGDDEDNAAEEEEGEEDEGEVVAAAVAAAVCASSPTRFPP